MNQYTTIISKRRIFGQWNYTVHKLNSGETPLFFTDGVYFYVNEDCKK